MINELVEERNRFLWENLSNLFEIEIVLVGYYKLEFESGKAVISIDRRKNIELFTHELLHLELRSFGLDSSECINFKGLNDYEIGVAGNLCNNLEHIFIFDEFVSLGFERSLFVEGLTTKEQLKKQISDLDILLGNKQYCDPNLYFISIYFTLKAEQYCGEKRQDYLEKLRRRNPQLYIECEKAFVRLLDIDLEDNPQSEFYKIISEIMPQEVMKK